MATDKLLKTSVLYPLNKIAGLKLLTAWQVFVRWTTSTSSGSPSHGNNWPQDDCRHRRQFQTFSKRSSQFSLSSQGRIRYLFDHKVPQVPTRLRTLDNSILLAR